MDEYTSIDEGLLSKGPVGTLKAGPYLSAPSISVIGHWSYGGQKGELLFSSLSLFFRFKEILGCCRVLRVVWPQLKEVSCIVGFQVPEFHEACIPC